MNIRRGSVVLFLWTAAPAVLAAESMATPQAGSDFDVNRQWTQDEMQAMRTRLVEKGFVEELCPSPARLTGLGSVFHASVIDAGICTSQRALFAVAQGNAMRVGAQERGATCEQMSVGNQPNLANRAPLSDKTLESPTSSIWICFSDVSKWAQRGGTTYGNTFLTPSSRAEFVARAQATQILQHEYRHFLQWMALGRQFPTAYLAAGTDPCTNVLEQSAGLDAGDYVCTASAQQ